MRGTRSHESLRNAREVFFAMHGVLGMSDSVVHRVPATLFGIWDAVVHIQSLNYVQGLGFWALHFICLYSTLRACGFIIFHRIFHPSYISQPCVYFPASKVVCRGRVKQ